MSQPLFFVDPETNEVKKVVEAKVVTLENIDEQIVEHQNAINNLNVEREKVLALTGISTDSAASEQPAQPEQAPVEQPAAPAEAPAPAATVTDNATGEQAQVVTESAPAEQPAAAPAVEPPSTDAAAQPPIAA